MYDLDLYNNSKSSSLIPCTCDNCNKVFKRVKKELKHGLEVRKQVNLFCSKKCGGEFNRKRKEIVNCKQCGKEVSLYPNIFCSQSCAAVFNNKLKHPIRKEKKEKRRYIKKKDKKDFNLKCAVCSKEFLHKNRIRCCSSECRRVNMSKGGLRSATVQKESRRSKNETLFADLCCNYFENTTTNEPIFNGWDADIILKNERVAVLWNGKWHYEKITEKHSVEQVQNRDKIKIKEICNLGFKPYVVKDMGKFNKAFVLSEFDKFKSLVSSL